MFAEKYRRAYDEVTPSQQIVSAVLRQAEGAQVAPPRRNRRKIRTMTAAAAVFLAVCAGGFAVLPVCAAQIPAFYRVIEFVFPGLADRLVPVEKSSSSQGITMEVEAVDLQGDAAEIIVSVRDEEGSALDRIHGSVDLFDSYHLSGIGADQFVGGCHFLTYDEETGRAYFKIEVHSSGGEWAGKLRFSVREILCNKRKERRTIDLSDVRESAETKVVQLSGTSGMMDEEDLPVSLQRTEGTPDDPRWQQAVLDLMDVEDCAAEDFTVTGSAYMDGVLRLQICMGDTRHADRHVEEVLVDAAGNEYCADFSVSWQEEIGETSYQFYEYWFINKIENREDLENYSLYGIFHNSGESVEGQWTVTFRVQ